MNTHKQRHGLLLTYLIIVFVANAALLILSLSKGNSYGVPSWAFVALGITSVFNLISVIALFKWKKWGFWGICLSVVITLVVNILIGLSVEQSLKGFIGLVVLYGVLHIGKDNKGWPQLD